MRGHGMMNRTLLAVAATLAAISVAGCSPDDAQPHQGSPREVLIYAYKAIDDGRYADVCAVMYEPENDCAQTVANGLAIGDFDGIGDVRVDEAAIEYSDDGASATIPVSALSWPNGRSYPFLSDENLELHDGQWWIQ